LYFAFSIFLFTLFSALANTQKRIMTFNASG
jgi:hypothetical protein